MATPETQTGRIEAAGLPAAEERKSSRRFITTAWWARRYRELSWPWRFNLAILVLAVLNAVTILIADAFGREVVVAICSAIYSAVVLVWISGFCVQMLLLVRGFFSSTRTTPPSDPGNGSGNDIVTETDR